MNKTVFTLGICTLISLQAVVGRTVLNLQAVRHAGDSSTIALQEVLIRENRLQIPFAKSNRNIQIIDSEQIKNLPARSINELLSFVSGVDIRQRGPFGSQADVSIDGGSFEQVLILLDGVKVLDAQTSHNALNLPIPTDAIERIEILRGAAARIYGINSLTGAINIVTKKAGRSEIDANLYSGSSFGKDTASRELYHGRGIQIGGSYVAGQQRHSLFGSHDSGNGYRYNTAFKNNKIFYQGAYPSQDRRHELSWIGGYVSSDFGANGFYAAPGDKESQEVVQTVLAAVGYTNRMSERFSWSPRISYRHGYDDYRYFRHDLTRARSQHRAHSIGAELNGVLQVGSGDVGMGLEMRHEEIASTNIGDHQRKNYGAYAEYRAELTERFSLNGGMYANFNSDYGWQVFPGIDLGYQLNENFRVTAHSGTGQRIPSFTDLYLNQRPGNVGNPSLLSETAWHTEAAVHFVGARFAAHVSYFYRDIDHFIDWVRMDNSDPWQPENFRQNRTQGFTFTSSYSLLQQADHYLKLGLNYTYLSPQFEDSNRQGYFSKYAIESLRHQLVGSVMWGKGAFTAAFANRFNERITYKQYLVSDIRMGYQIRRANVYMDIQNLFDVAYIEAAAVPMPGRWFSLGFRYGI